MNFFHTGAMMKFFLASFAIHHNSMQIVGEKAHFSFVSSSHTLVKYKGIKISLKFNLLAFEFCSFERKLFNFSYTFRREHHKKNSHVYKLESN